MPKRGARAGDFGVRSRQTAIRRRHRMGGVVAFSPDDVSGLVAWYDFSDITTLFTDGARSTPVTADADAIGSVTDKSASGYHLVRGGAAGTEGLYKVNIQNGLSVCRFDGLGDPVGDWLTVSGVTADTSWTCFIVAVKRSAVAAAVKDLMGFSTVGTALVATNSAWHASEYVIYANEALGVNAIAGSTPTVWGAVAVRVNSAASLDAYYAGGSATNIDPRVNWTTGTVIDLGNAQGLVNPGDYDVAEFLRYSSALSATDMNLVGNYLATKWGITWSAVS